MKELTYCEAGVDRVKRAEAKNFSLLSPNKAIKTPFNDLIRLRDNVLSAFTSDGVGTKVLVAQLAGWHEGIGVDGVAMVANDCIRCGAKPLLLSDVIDVKQSRKELLQEIIKGLKKGADEADCVFAGGETADLSEIINGVGENPYHLNLSCYGEVEEKKLVDGSKVKEGDCVIGLRSSGLHSNGLSLARRILFKEWGGAFAFSEFIDELDNELWKEVLKPTRIYVKPVLETIKDFEVKAAVHVTGDAYQKFWRVTEFCGKGFELNCFEPQPIFPLIQEAAKKTGSRVSDEEMLKTFNLGWGFALVVSKQESDGVIELMEKKGVEARKIGFATKEKKVACVFKGKKIML